MYKEKRVSLVISLIILVGITIIGIFNLVFYSRIIKDDIKNISKLSSTSIYSKINNEITKPIFVSLTMANDSFVKKWLLEEKETNKDDIVQYLDGIHKKYGYNSVFLISNQTMDYYRYNGFFKTVSKNDDHDIWYYTLLENDYVYDIDVDQDEANQHFLTVFVNCKIYEDEKVIGVTGVGIRMDYIQKLLKEFEEQYGLEAFLVDENGLVQVHTNLNYIEKRNILDEEIYISNTEKLFQKKQDVSMIKEKINNTEQYIISHYVEELDWYLIVRKDTSILKKSIYSQVIYDFFILVLILFLVISISIKVVKNHQIELISIAQTDSLTGLLNRRGFDKFLNERLADTHNKPFTLFLFDVDNFKYVNDNFGHIQGDKILKKIILICNDVLGHNIIARWGGDEFTGIIELNINEAHKLLEKIKENIFNDEELNKYNITVSIGATEKISIDTEDSIIKRADKAMYEAKTTGKNKVILQ